MSDKQTTTSEAKTFNLNVLKLPFSPTDWVDADERMFHACFAILGQYVENELGTEPWDFMGGDEAMYRGFRRHSADDRDGKAIDLWLWYRDELPALEAAYAQDINDCYSGEMVTEGAGNGLRRIVSVGKVREPKFPHDYPETVKDQKLRELIELRRALWT